MVAGTVQTAIITPVDLLKIRMQLQTAPQGTPGYVGSLRMLGRVLQREGFLGALTHRRRLHHLRILPALASASRAATMPRHAALDLPCCLDMS